MPRLSRFSRSKLPRHRTAIATDKVDPIRPGATALSLRELCSRIPLQYLSEAIHWGMGMLGIFDYLTGIVDDEQAALQLDM